MNTEIEIPIAQLKSVLPGLSKIVSRSSNLPVLQCVKVALSLDEKTIELQGHNGTDVRRYLPGGTRRISRNLIPILEKRMDERGGLAASNDGKLICIELGSQIGQQPTGPIDAIDRGWSKDLGCP